MARLRVEDRHSLRVACRKACDAPDVLILLDRRAGLALLLVSMLGEQVGKPGFQQAGAP
ncbi:hypothetical protein [Metallibacterium sp.]|uniref:hypothetical protein n=1 Tax=Metallibacterium sp. TaxID=2940281 RepID=UPI00262938EE|nr:hypothetical protein [Metallibacterium sp.]